MPSPNNGPIIFPSTDYKVQSRYLHLQTAGSTGLDGSAYGAHARWVLLGNLGDIHLPKGDAAATPIHFNRRDDYVTLYRSEYSKKVPTIVDFRVQPNVVNDAECFWIYRPGGANINVYIRFRDPTQYATVRSVVDPRQEPLQFLRKYSPALIEAELKDQLCFAAEFDVVRNAETVMRVEALSVESNVPLSPLFVSSRRVFTNETWCPQEPGRLSAVRSGSVNEPTTQDTNAVQHDCVGPNLLPNGGFEQDPAASEFAFETDYTLQAGIGTGIINVTENARSINPYWIGLPHSGRKFLAVDGHLTAGADVLRVRLTVRPFASYSFKGWLATLFAGDVSIPLEFRFASGDRVETFRWNTPATVDLWQPFEFVWRSGNADSVVVSITSLSTALVGNDFGLDDLTFCDTSAVQHDCVGPNLLPNGGFEPDPTASEFAFETDYTLQAGIGTGIINVTENARSINPYWVGLPHSGRKFLAVDGHLTAGADVLRIRLTVRPFASYSFKGWLATLFSGDVSIPLEFRFASGDRVETFRWKTPATVDLWQPFEFVWRSGNADGVVVSITSLSTALGGNDFGLDDLTFCETEDTECHARIRSENIRSIRFDVTNGYPRRLEIEIYDAYIRSVNWQMLERLALTVDDDVAIHRLEPVPGTVNGRWQKFNDHALLNLENYRYRWTRTGGIREDVQRYLEASNRDPRPDQTVDALRKASRDFHLARMLGLGYLDNTLTSDTAEFIYLIVYDTDGELDDGRGVRPVRHYYMGAPTRPLDHRLPLPPVLRPVTYGSAVDPNEPEPSLLTDKNGYAFSGLARHVNLFVEPSAGGGPLQPFFIPPDEFIGVDTTSPVFFGVEYRGQGETGWRKSELSHDTDYRDLDAPPQFETLPLPPSGDPLRPVFHHEEHENGVHEYCGYTINGFSRASQIGNVVATDVTTLASVDPHVILDQVQKDLVGGAAVPQSPYLYLQAAGSDGSDGSVTGIQLRWDLLRTLGETHLPKGNLAAGAGAPYPAPYGFHRADDFVRLIRMPYLKPYPCIVNFFNTPLAGVVESGPQRLWRFDTVVQGTGAHREVIVRFADVAQYDTIRTSLNPLTSAAQFLTAYKGVVEAEVTNQLCFALSVMVRHLASAAEGSLRAESITVSENLPGTELFISCRQAWVIPISAAQPPVRRICAENVRYFRFDYDKCVPVELRLETYEQFMAASIARHRAAWRAIGAGFAVTDQDAVAYQRLEDLSVGKVDRKWPHYAGADSVSGTFTTSVANYKAKWEPTDPNGLQKGVVRYLTLSMDPTNATATAALPTDNLQDGGSFRLSYLRMLKILMLDYHVARMLGLGTIDAAVDAGAAIKFVYVAIYRTVAPLEPGGPPSPRTHLYMTLPTATLDYRLPIAPVQTDPTFGITIDNGTSTPTQLTDVNGYTPFDDARIINLHLAPYDTMQSFGPFFVPPTPFCSTDVTKPVFYGFKYKLVSEANDRTPELSNDEEFDDPAGVPEVVPLLPQVSPVSDEPNPPIYTHHERENGLHRYAFYGVNWFSRPSALGNPKDVDTLLPTRHTLLPPSNLAVQIIQPEEPPMLTTSVEQQMLSQLPSGDATLVRCTFDWNDNHYRPQKFSTSNIYAEKVQLFFRQEPPRAVQGAIQSVTTVSNDLVEVRTEPYVLTSVSPPQTVSPAIVAGDEPRFAGSSFAADQVLYEVESVAQSSVAGEGAVFRIRKQKQSTVSDFNNNNQFSASVQVTIPVAGKRFLAVENMDNPTNWGTNGRLAKEVSLVNFLESGQLHTETVVYPDGSQATFNVGGITETANIAELPDLDPNAPLANTGIFEITFDAHQLAAHPDPAVEWYRGIVRIAEAPAGVTKKTLAVWKIDTSGTTLKLTVFDATISEPGYKPIQTGAAVLVNFHPGYRVYLKAQPGVLDETTTLPPVLQTSKQTLLAARSRNSALPSDSHLTAPVVLQSRRVSPPLPPNEPIGPLYATRPDFYGKATWTMDVQVVDNATRKPYGMVFYRANERAILDTLYTGVTADAIEEALRTLPAADAAFNANRWSDLVNVRNLHTDGGFNEYITGGYRFPNPDNGAYEIPGTTITPFVAQQLPGDPTPTFQAPGHPTLTFPVGGQNVPMLDVVKGAIEGTFLPLTESPLVYQFIRNGTQTSSRKPVVRNTNGDLLPFSSPDFDPSPMAVKYIDLGATKVRFTDYTLDGASRNIYFYYAIELTEEMKLGPRSEIAGPIRLVNAYPPEAPAIRKVTSVLEDSVLQIPTGVKLLVNAYIASEGITTFNLYRATNAGDAAAVRTMKLVGAFPAEAGVETELVDEFADLDFPPFGDPLFYCVVALREITNERDALELIPSLSSTLARASIIDVNNPIAPAIEFSSDPPTMSHPVQLNNVVLSWSKATHNATYRLSRQDSTGNWTLIHTVRTNDPVVTVPLAATDLGTGTLSKQDANGNAIAHRFRLEVENSSGLFSRNENVLSVPQSCAEARSFFTDLVTYADAFQQALPLSDRQVDPAVTTFPGTMTFQDIVPALPAGHVFDRIEIIVADDAGHAARKTIAAPGGTVIFQHGDGTGIVLDGSALNVRFDIRVRLFTDTCRDGMAYRHKLHYGPEIALMTALPAVLSYADSQAAPAPLEATHVVSGVAFPTTMDFTDISVLPAGHALTRIDIHVQDDLGGSHSASINTPNGSVTFHHGDGGLILDVSAPNRTYEIVVTLITSLSPGGVTLRYTVLYV